MFPWSAHAFGIAYIDIFVLFFFRLFGALISGMFPYCHCCTKDQSHRYETRDPEICPAAQMQQSCSLELTSDWQGWIHTIYIKNAPARHIIRSRGRHTNCYTLRILYAHIFISYLNNLAKDSWHKVRSGLCARHCEKIELFVWTSSIEARVEDLTKSQNLTATFGNRWTCTSRGKRTHRT